MPLYASSYLAALASKKRSRTSMILVPAGSSESYFGALGASQKNEISCNIPFATQRRIVPKLCGSVWFISSLGKAFSPGKISFARCQEAAAGEEGCWSCPGGNARKNCRIQDGISFQQSPWVCSQTPYLSDKGSLISQQNDEFPSQRYYCSIPQGAFNFF